jgi:glutamyl-tRNA reductase
VFVANRRYNRAIGLAERFGGSALRINDLPVYLETADIVVSATDSPHPLIERPELEHVMQERDSSPLLMIDLAVPRDIDPDCRELTGVSLSDVDDLQRMVDRNASNRENEAAKAERILDAEFDLYREWLEAQSVAPTIAELRGRADAIVEQVLSENENRWENLSEADRERAEVLARAVANRLLHEPTARLRGLADSENGYRDLALLREIFGLDSASEPIGGEENGHAEIASLDEHRREKRA